MLFGVCVVVVIVLLFAFSNKSGKRHYNQRPSRYSYSTKKWHFFEEPSDGEDFEELIEHKLSKLERAGAKVIRNCYLLWSNGTTTQIDDILIFRSGIYVIECKDYSGWIFGDGSQENWTQTLPYGYDGDYVKIHFYNPIKQNQNHMKCIRQKLQNDSSIPIHNIVVFGDSCTLKKIENTLDAHVINVGNLYETIYRIEQKTGQRLSETDIENIYTRLRQDVAENPSLSEEHIRNVERIKQQKEQEKRYTGNICPRCGSPLVLKSGQYGRFYGCMRYPSCKYTKRSDDSQM